MSTTVETIPRPRVEGDREREIFAATLEVLAEVGLDRLTMDAVATRSRASKATLYRRWHSKVALVIDALLATKPEVVVPDTGSLRGDLVASFCSPGGLADKSTSDVFAGVITALTTDPEFAAAFRRDVLAPRLAATRLVFERARDRGELRPDADLDLLVPALSGIVLHRLYVLGTRPDEALVTRVIDQIILPAALAH